MYDIMECMLVKNCCEEDLLAVTFNVVSLDISASTLLSFLFLLCARQ